MQTHGPLTVESFIEPMFQQNGYVLVVREAPGAPAWVIDPGFPPQPARILQGLGRHEATLQAIVLTHCHPDHMAGVSSIRKRWPEIPIFAPRDEADWLTDPAANMSAQMGFPVTAPPATHLLSHGDTLSLGPLEWEVRDVSGHSPGGLAFYCAAVGVVVVGDALFAGSIGRYDFPGSSGVRLLANIRRNLLSLPDETVVYSGHGPPTTIGAERSGNPHLQPGMLDDER